MSLTLLIILLNLLVTWTAFQRQDLFLRWSHRPWDVLHQHQYERWVSSGFVHADWLHFAINMFVLWQFGTMVETTFALLADPVTGRIRYATLYLLVLIASSVPTFLKHKNNPYYASVGASGAVSGILFAYVLFHPMRPIYLYGVIPIQGIVAGVAYLVYSSWASRQGSDRINHDAHFYGAVAGLLGTLLFYPESLRTFLHELQGVFS